MSSKEKHIEYEKLSNNEVVSSLWSPSAIEKCRLGLADTILFENGLPSRYFITGSSGEVKLQRSLQIPAVSARWLKISEQLSTQYVAVVRQPGLTKFLTKDAFDSFFADSRQESSVLSIHSFLGSGHNSMIYRSFYNMNVSTGRFKTATHTYSVPFQEPLYVLHEEKIRLNESRATSINKVTDLATTTVVRYVEKMLKVQIVEFVVDYVIDKKSQIWMLWSTKALFQLPSNSGNRLDQFDSSAIQLNPFNSSPSSRAQSPSRDVRNDASSLSQQFHEMAEPYKKDPRGAQVATVSATHTFGALDENSPVGKSKFPNPSNCKGDFCNLDIMTTGQLILDDKQASLHAQHFFTDAEILHLRKDPRFTKMMEFGSGDRGYGTKEMNMRSIILARKEKRGLLHASAESSWLNFPSPSGGGKKFAGSLLEQDSAVIEGSNKKGRVSVFDSDKLLDSSSLVEDDSMPSNLMLHYETVRVCSVCYNVYQCLDWARHLLEKAKAVEKDKDKGEHHHHKHNQPKKLTDTMDSHSSTVELSRPGTAGSPPTSPARQRSSRKGRRAGDLKSSSSVKELNAKATWKSQVTSSVDRKMKRNELAVLDNYVRGKSQTLTTNSTNQQQSSSISPSKRARSQSPDRGGGLNNASLSAFSTNQEHPAPELYIGQILLACSDVSQAEPIRSILIESGYAVHWFKEGRMAINEIIENWKNYDCVVTERELPLLNAFEFAHSIRDYEKKMRVEKSLEAQKSGNNNPESGKFMNHRIPVIIYTAKTNPTDLSSYMKADMDGCLSQPVDRMSLVNTMRAAIPHHLAPLIKPEITLEEMRKSQKIQKIGLLGEPEDSVDSASMALKSMSIVKNEVGSEFQGIAQLDADTKIPFMVINGSKYARMKNVMNERFFNLVVCHDIFDTYERMKILLQPIIQRYQMIQILVWNYPGQAHTEWRKTQSLNNEYLAACLNELLGQVGDNGSKDFNTNHPFYILGYGYGANIASYYLANYRVPNVRGLLSVSGWAFLDSYLAGVMHDCINIFQSTPETRPDLPVYFFSRFLFSKDYLAKVSVPLALNIYTAVYNAISVKGRIQLCNGVLQSVDVRPLLKSVDCPLICIHSSQDSFSRPLHVEPYVTYRLGEVRSIYQALLSPAKTCLVWLTGGHEIFQENRKQIILLLEQILTGYHEVHEITFPSASSMNLDLQLTNNHGGRSTAGRTGRNTTAGTSFGEESKSLEDKFTKSVLSYTEKYEKSNNNSKLFNQSAELTSPIPRNSLSRGDTFRSNETSPSRQGLRSRDRNSAQNNSSTVLPPVITGGHTSRHESWEQYSGTIIQKQTELLTLDNKNQANKKKGNTLSTSDSVSLKETQRMDNLPYLADVKAYPEVKEYMNWRLKRNKKRLQRLQLAAQSIQNAFRAYLARNMVKNIRKKRAALTIQRVFRGWKGRRKFFHQARRLWGAIILQRTWRGYAARKWYFFTRLKIAAAANIQRVFRGFRARKRVRAIRAQQNHASSVIQAMVRRFRARKEAWKRRQLRNGAMTIQRIFRGFLGRKKAIAERDKYIFSKSQSQGIEFGRQMLLEHKLHVTRLQSDVTLLAQEKVTVEEQIEALLEEISGFEEGVRTLEKEMHQLSKVEAEAAAFMDEDSRFELREQKMRLDREFGEMLSKIANRKDLLVDLEKKLAAIDKTRQSKEEDLRTLERKLVVLLEDQQKELTAIRRKQDIRGQLLAASHAELSKATASGVSTAGSKGSGVSVGGPGQLGGYSSGPSMQEKKQAAQLMQSTETLMKFGFMSMSMTYFSSLNMIKALRTVSAQDTVMAALADVHSQRAVGVDGTVGGVAGGGSPGGGGPKNPLAEKEGKVSRLKPGQLPGQQSLQVSSWSVEDVAKWLQTLSLGQYSEAFIDSAVDGEFLYDLTDDDLKNTLGIEHRLHRKKILNCVARLKMAETQNESRLGVLQHTLFNPEMVKKLFFLFLQKFISNVFLFLIDWKYATNYGTTYRGCACSSEL
jgi:CheY-like chemotaxis protein/predicted  nucleic acid-binding Zn-ribbon protein